MSSDEMEFPESSTSSQKTKSKRKSTQIPLESGQRCIASAMSKIINRMVNKELQQHCKDLLEMEDLAETEARILFILQQIDKEQEEEEENKRRRLQKRLEKANNKKKD